MKPGSSFEDYIYFVYQNLLNLRGESVKVSRRTTFRLPSSETYEVDIFYEFVRAGVTHRVAIECKDWKTPVDQGRVLEFHQKIKNIGEDIVGVFVSKTGYQSGAEKVAARHGILTLSIDDIPSLMSLLSSQIQANFLPEDDCIGEPFWYIAELEEPNGKPTGTYYALPSDRGGKIVPLFISRQHALAVHKNLPDRDLFRFYGMAQHKLRGMLVFSIDRDVKFGLVFCCPSETGEIATLVVSGKELKDDYLLLDFPSSISGSV